jgi:hypothetical protein
MYGSASPMTGMSDAFGRAGTFDQLISTKRELTQPLSLTAVTFSHRCVPTLRAPSTVTLVPFCSVATTFALAAGASRMLRGSLGSVFTTPTLPPSSAGCSPPCRRSISAWTALMRAAFPMFLPGQFL